ncbi:MAG: Holliday junction branch migration protein RuvA [Firmicutes bacterium]|nr:Holliday junction branch migration protein RuvA [Bacillota bacterium]
MYNYIIGSVTHIEDGQITLNTGSVGFLINASQSLQSKAKFGELLTAFVHLDIKETSHTLYGFESTQEREFFQLLLTVSGVGAKSALAMMSLGVNELARAISSRNSLVLSKVKGVSAKLADKVILDLRAKVMKKFDAVDVEVTQLEKSSEVNDAIMGLMSLGMNKSIVEQLVSMIDCTDKTAEEIIKLCLSKRGG